MVGVDLNAGHGNSRIRVHLADHVAVGTNSEPQLVAALDDVPMQTILDSN